MRNTPDAIDFIRRAEREGVRAAITARDGPFHDYSQADAERAAAYLRAMTAEGHRIAARAKPRIQARGKR